jgi:hypothetical protein
MWDSMMSSEDRERFRERQGGDTARLKVDRTAIAATLAISTGLRRTWLAASIALLLRPPGALLFWINVLNHRIQESNAGAWFAIVAGFSVVWGLWGVGLWIKSLFVRWMGRKIQADYADGELFKR